nr:hypothetical protein [Tanacetum cinerariifolium]
ACSGHAQVVPRLRGFYPFFLQGAHEIVRVGRAAVGAFLGIIAADFADTGGQGLHQQIAVRVELGQGAFHPLIGGAAAQVPGLAHLGGEL